MMLSAELEELLTKHSNQINTQHIDLFLKLINELRICNYVNHLYVLIISYVDLIVKIFIHNLSTFVDVKYSIHNVLISCFFKKLNKRNI